MQEILFKTYYSKGEIGSKYPVTNKITNTNRKTELGVLSKRLMELLEIQEIANY